MRAAMISILFVAACEPSIAPGTYLCGPEQLCPEGLKCNGGVDPAGDGADNLCVSPSKAMPFECGARNNEVPGDDAPATAQSLGDLSCVSLVRETRGCLPAGDVGDFYTFRVVDGCTDVRVRASIGSRVTRGFSSTVGFHCGPPRVAGRTHLGPARVIMRRPS